MKISIITNIGSKVIADLASTVTPKGPMMKEPNLLAFTILNY
ncbi:hypothetical protein [Nitrosopumilus sp.]|nr:hypothetical protein [Nitrosopumilus sp.]